MIATQRRVQIGIDVGGTNTDGVVLDGREVVAKTKAPTTPEVTDGITLVLKELLESSRVAGDEIAAVMIGTTHFTNAFVHGEGLCSVAIVRLCLPATQAVPPMADWPEPALARLRSGSYLCRGGHEFDGRPIAELDEQEIRRVAQRIRQDGLQSIAITAVHSPVDPSHERRAAEIFAQELPGIPVSLSHEIGRIGMLERENATIVNASLRLLARSVTRGFREAVDRVGIDSRVFISQNDGTLATMEHVEKYPVTTFTSGPTNSMRGAAFLSGLPEAIVVDIGGTTADVGVLQNGFPRETSAEALVGGVRTNFRLPDVVSLGIGGGSRVVISDSGIQVGPGSVGFGIRTQAQVFGGSVLTATDAAVAAGRSSIGEVGLVAIDAGTAIQVMEHIDERIAAAADRMRAGPAPLPVLLVGGGSVLLGSALPGGLEVHLPPHFEVANAVGAAIAQVSGSCERIFPLARVAREDALAEVSQLARDAAVSAGAEPDSVRIVDIEEVAMAYLPDAQTRIKVRAVGELGMVMADAAIG